MSLNWALDLTVTAGLRVDMPLFMDKPEANAAFNADYASEGIATGVLPDTKIMLSPRLGFNWDVLGNKTLQVRGVQACLPAVFLLSGFPTSSQTTEISMVHTAGEPCQQVRLLLPARQE